MKGFLASIGLAALFFQPVFATVNAHQKPVIAPQPTACIASTFSSTGDIYWRIISLKLTNKCGIPVDFQNASITFLNKIPLNTNVWGTFNPLSYPDNDLHLSSQIQSDKTYLASVNFHFPSYQGVVSVLPAGKSITLNYGAEKELHIGSANVYLGTPAETGTITLTNVTSQPDNVTQPYSLVHLIYNGQPVSDIQLSWGSTQNITGLAPGVYAFSADSVKESSGANSYQGTVTPSTINLTADQIANATVSYTLVPQSGQIAIGLQALPSELAGYTEKPVCSLRNSSTGSSVTQVLNWDSTTTVSQLINNMTYSFSTPSITFNGYQCTPTFNPTSLVASGSIPVSNLTFACMSTPQNNVTLNVAGAPTTLSSLNVTLTPNSGSTVTQNISLNNGSGSSVVKLPNNVIYTVSADSVSGYALNFNPQPLTSTSSAIENISLTASSGTPVDMNGQLKVCGTHLCNQDGVPIQLRGMSSHGLQWYGLNVCLKTASLDALANNFKANVIRLSLYVQEGGYETDPTGFTNQVNQLISEVTKRGMYALVDWHILTPGDPNYNLTRAKKFFTDVATANKGKVNLIYEICNEPNGVAWSTVKNYAEQVIPVIRAIDPNAVILVGTRAWSSLGVSDGFSSQEIISNPVNASNIMYSFHFYAVSHRDDYLSELDKASNLLPIFVSEWGSQDYSGDGANDFAMSDKYIALMANKKISWTNWNFSDDALSGAIWKAGTCSKNIWTDANLKPSGVYVKSKILGT